MASSEQTTKRHLNKPQPEDFVNVINDICDNMDNLDDAVPDSRKVNGHALNGDITVSKSDVGLGNVDNVQQVPATRKVNNKPLSSDINLQGTDIQVSASDSRKVDAAIANCDNETASLKSALKYGLLGITGNYIIEYTLDNHRYNTPEPDGTAKVDFANPAYSTNYRCTYVSCNPGDVFYINGQGANSGRSWAFVDANDVVLSREESTSVLTNKKVVAPANASKIVINCNKSNYPNAYSYYGNSLLKDKTESIIETLIANDQDIMIRVNNETYIKDSSFIFEQGNCNSGGKVDTNYDDYIRSSTPQSWGDYDKIYIHNPKHRGIAIYKVNSAASYENILTYSGDENIVFTPPSKSNTYMIKCSKDENNIKPTPENACICIYCKDMNEVIDVFARDKIYNITQKANDELYILDTKLEFEQGNCNSGGKVNTSYDDYIRTSEPQAWGNYETIYIHNPMLRSILIYRVNSPTSYTGVALYNGEEHIYFSPKHSGHSYMIKCTKDYNNVKPTPANAKVYTYFPLSGANVFPDNPFLYGRFRCIGKQVFQTYTVINDGMPYLVVDTETGDWKTYDIDTSLSSIPYSSTFYTEGDVFLNRTIGTFHSAMNNPYSVIYTKRGGVPDENNNRACYYGGVCSTFAAYMVGNPLYMVTREFAKSKHVNKVEISDFESIKTGMVMALNGHSFFISGVYYDSNGNRYIEKMEESGSVLRSIWKWEDFRDTYVLDPAIEVYDFKVKNQITYEEDPYPDDVIPEFGCNTWYKLGQTINVYISNESDKIYYKKKGAENYTQISVSDDTIDVTSYLNEAVIWYLTTDPDTTTPCIVSVVDLGTGLINGTTLSLSGYSSNVKPLWYQIYKRTNSEGTGYYYEDRDGKTMTISESDLENGFVANDYIENNTAVITPPNYSYCIRVYYDTGYGQCYLEVYP